MYIAIIVWRDFIQISPLNITIANPINSRIITRDFKFSLADMNKKKRIPGKLNWKPKEQKKLSLFQIKKAKTFPGKNIQEELEKGPRKHALQKF